jgi:hypothetical protein
MEASRARDLDAFARGYGTLYKQGYRHLMFLTLAILSEYPKIP